MPQQKSATMMEIFSEVLANLAFMFSEEEPVDVPAGAVWLETTISYQGPCCGHLTLWCTRDFATLLAANLLGIDPDEQDSQADAEDAVKEFMNIVCGQLVTALHGTEDVHNLTIPVIRELPEQPDLHNGDDTDSSTVAIEEHLVRLNYQAEECD